MFNKNCTTIATINFRIFLVSPKRNSVLLSYSLFLPMLPSNPKHLLTFLYINLAYPGHLMKIESVCGHLCLAVSSFIYVGVCINMSFLFLTKYVYTMFCSAIHQLTCFWLSWMMLLWHSSTDFCVDICFQYCIMQG